MAFAADKLTRSLPTRVCSLVVNVGGTGIVLADLDTVPHKLYGLNAKCIDFVSLAPKRVGTGKRWVNSNAVHLLAMTHEQWQ